MNSSEQKSLLSRQYSSIKFQEDPNASQIGRLNPLSDIKKNPTQNSSQTKNIKLVSSNYIGEQQEVLSSIQMQQSIQFQYEPDHSQIRKMNPNSDILDDAKNTIQNENNYNMEASLQFYSNITTSQIQINNPINQSVKRVNSMKQTSEPMPKISMKKGSTIRKKNQNNLDDNIDIKKPSNIDEAQQFQTDIEKKMSSQISNKIISQKNPMKISIKKQEDKKYIHNMHTSKSQISHQQTQNPIHRYKKNNITMIRINNNQQFQSYFIKYQIQLQGALLIHYLSQQTNCGIFDKDQINQKKFFTYITKLRALYLVFNNQQHRMNSNIVNKQKQKLIGRCKDLVHSIYQQLKSVNQQITEDFKHLYNFPSYKTFIQIKLKNPTKIYTIFKNQQINNVYEDVLKFTYAKVYKILEQKRTQIHLRMSLLILLCWKYRTIFVKDQLVDYFGSFYNDRKIIRRDRIQSDQFIEYLIQGKSKVILDHHNKLREYLSVR